MSDQFVWSPHGIPVSFEPPPNVDASAAPELSAQALEAGRESKEREYKEFVELFTPKLRGCARRMGLEEVVIDDIIQRALFKAWKNDVVGQCDGHGPRILKYLRRTVRNTVYNESRSSKRDRRTRDTYAASLLTSTNEPRTPLDATASRDLMQRVDGVLRELPRIIAECWYLKYMEGLTTPEAAEVLEVNVETVKKYAAKANRHLRPRVAAMVGYRDNARGGKEQTR